MDITPVIPAGRQVIERYGSGRFLISGRVYDGSVLVFADRTLAWPIDQAASVTAAAFAPVTEAAGEVELLLLGCGGRAEPVPAALRAALRADGVMLDAMDTGAACRTYNVLMAEDRRVAAALIAVE